MKKYSSDDFFNSYTRFKETEENKKENTKVSNSVPSLEKQFLHKEELLYGIQIPDSLEALFKLIERSHVDEKGSVIFGVIDTDNMNEIGIDKLLDLNE